jgi:hypothetical protein
MWCCVIWKRDVHTFLKNLMPPPSPLPSYPKDGGCRFLQTLLPFYQTSQTTAISIIIVRISNLMISITLCIIISFTYKSQDAINRVHFSKTPTYFMGIKATFNECITQNEKQHFSLLLSCEHFHGTIHISKTQRSPQIFLGHFLTHHLILKG